MHDIGQPQVRFSIDDTASEGKAVRQKGGSANDEREMVRMGKKQELRVSPYQVWCRGGERLTFDSATSSSWVSSVLSQSFSRHGSAH